MRKIISQNIVIIFTLSVVVYAVYFLLLRDNHLNTSISSIIALSHRFEYKTHIIVLGLLPIYIATVIFGSTMIGIYLGLWAKQFFLRDMKKGLVVQKRAL